MTASIKDVSLSTDRVPSKEELIFDGRRNESGFQ
jgi:hypothetical protein